MDPKSIAVIGAIAGAVGGVITGTISSLLAPWVNWKLQEKRMKIEAQRAAIAAWRRMIQDVARRRGTSGKLLELLEREENYHSLRSHLGQETIGELHRPHTVRVGSTIDTGLSLLAEDVSRLEREWKLI